MTTFMVGIPSTLSNEEKLIAGLSGDRVWQCKTCNRIDVKHGAEHKRRKKQSGLNAQFQAKPYTAKSGKVKQFGRGEMKQVSTRVNWQFETQTKHREDAVESQH